MSDLHEIRGALIGIREDVKELRGEVKELRDEVGQNHDKVINMLSHLTADLVMAGAIPPKKRETAG